MKQIASILSLFILTTAFVAAQDKNARVDALQKYILEKDYPEVFSGQHYKTRIEGWVDADVDNDGQNEIVILFYPHYRQSAPILIYKIDKDLNVSRVVEGLAPGPLQNLSSDYLDSHNLGVAVDMSIDSKQTRAEDLFTIAAKSKMNGFVTYDTFEHLDGREGLPAYIDMHNIKLPNKKKNCDGFEFSHVKQIAVGHLKEDETKNYLAVWVGSEIYVYLIQGETAFGLLNKKLWVIKAPIGFNGFEHNKGLTYSINSISTTLTLK